MLSLNDECYYLAFSLFSSRGKRSRHGLQLVTCELVAQYSQVWNNNKARYFKN
jgi:hypothetical protein